MKAKAKTTWLFNALQIVSFRMEDEERLFHGRGVAWSVLVLLLQPH